MVHPTGFEPVASAFGGQTVPPLMAENRHFRPSWAGSKRGQNPIRSRLSPEFHRSDFVTFRPSPDARA